jgi:hypothetical protein
VWSYHQPSVWSDHCQPLPAHSLAACLTLAPRLPAPRSACPGHCTHAPTPAQPCQAATLTHNRTEAAAG